MPQIYDSIGQNYASKRQPDERWARQISACLGDEPTVLNIGAGSGSYEPRDKALIALEPSSQMIAQRPSGAAPVVQGIAEQLPFSDDCFDTAIGILTTHHWSDPAQGFREMLRVAKRQVIVTWDPAVTAEFWLIRDYLPEIAEREQNLATLATALEHLPGARVEPMPVPADCTDGFLGAYWKRPEIYLLAEARQAISGFALLDNSLVKAAMNRLEKDLSSGRWALRNQELEGLDQLDLGYRIVSRGPSPAAQDDTESS